MEARTREEAYDFLVRAGVIRPNERTLTGQEKEEMWLILQLLEVTEQTNNQRFISNHYIYGDYDYSVTFFDQNEYEIIEIKH